MAERKGLRAAVIGSGFGGLAVAIRLAAQGFQTTIFEGRDKPGGRAYVYEKDGFSFDGGPTVITAPHTLAELFALGGVSMADAVEMLPVTPFYRLLWSDGDRFDYDGDGESMLRQIRERSAEDAAGYERFVEYSRQVFDAGYTQLAGTPFLSFRDMVRVAPTLGRLRADRSVYATVARFVKDEHVRQALSFHALLVGGNPFETSAIYTLIHYLERKWGVYFPRGGTGALVAALVKLFEGMGGEVRLSSPVTNVRVQQTGAGVRHLVTTPQASREPFDVVVSNADVHHTYSRLYAGTPGADRMRRKLERMAWSMSLFVLYFGTDRTYADDVVHHTVLFGPRYRELLDDIFHGHSLPDDFSLYLHAPHLTDPGMAPPGGGAFYVLSPVPHLGNADVDWHREGPRYAEKLFEYLEGTLPDLRKHLVTSHWITPLDFRYTLNSFHGSAFSCAPTLTQSAWFRPHNRCPHIPGLYIVGAGTHPGAGVPGVVRSAEATARCVAADWGSAA